MKKILITGGAGFVGTILSKKLAEEGFFVTIIDNLSNSSSFPQHKNIHSLNYDLSKPDWVRELRDRHLDCIIHCAAQSSNAISQQFPIQDLLINQLATLNLLNYCKENGVRRFIFTSSMSVYGNPTKFPTPTHTTPNPLTFYGIHKATSEDYLRISQDLDWTIFRLYTTYGTGQYLSNRKQGLIKIYLSYILEGKPIKIHGSLNRLRDVIHVDDVVAAIGKSLFRTETFGKIYNLGTGESHSIHHIINELLKASGKELDYPKTVEQGDIGDPAKTQADISNAIKDIEWLPKITLTEGILKTINGYKFS